MIFFIVAALLFGLAAASINKKDDYGAGELIFAAGGLLLGFAVSARAALVSVTGRLVSRGFVHTSRRTMTFAPRLKGP